MEIAFTKMHGLGNDFMVIDAIHQSLSLSEATIRQWCDRHFGVGCDQVLLVEAADEPGVDFRYRIFNADGREVGQCGNGVRCLARFIRDQGLSDKSVFTVATQTRKMLLSLDGDQISVNMGEPELDPNKIPFLVSEQAAQYPIDVAGLTLNVGAVSMGNPHVVVSVDNIDQAPVSAWGPVLERHPRFPEGVNVGFMEIVNETHIRLRVHERSVGETLACGSGACAAMAVGRIQELLSDRVTVELPGGALTIVWSGRGALMMTGPAEKVFEGKIML